MDTLSMDEINAANLTDWRKLAQALHTRYRIPDFTAGARFVSAVADAAEQANHHPDITLRYGLVDLVLGTHEAGLWVTQKDVDLARTISDLAREHGLEASPQEVTQVEPGLDTADQGRVAAFWSVVLTGEADSIVHETVLDPTGRVPNVWFQATDSHDEARQRWHFDVWVDPTVAERRIAAAVAAGGTVVDDEGAPRFTVLADADGNKVCICTNDGRD